MNKIIKLNLLTACVCIANQGYALEVLNDQVLGSVTGQDGITITHEVSRVEVAQANWIDYSEANKAPIKLGLHDVKITPNANNTNIISKLDFDVGTAQLASGAVGAGIQLRASVSPFTAVASKIMMVCSPNCAPGEQDQNLGSLSISTISPLEVYLATTNGLFNRNDKAHLDLKLQNATISHGMNGNSLVLKDFNFNLSADGYMYIDPKDGIVLTTMSADGQTDNFVELGRVEDKSSNVHSSRTGAATKPGVNVELRYGKTGETPGNLIRLGASGALSNGKIMLNANQAGAANFNIVNDKRNETAKQAANGYGFTQGGGLHMAMSADFTRADAGKDTVSGRTPTTFELGHSGTGSYAIEFSNLTRLNVRNSDAAGAPLSSSNAYIDFGDIYINTVRTNSLGFVVNDQMKTLLGAAANELIYNPSPTVNPQTMTLVAVRGMDFQAIARKARFISDNSLPVNDASSGTWGLGIPIYNLNANLGIYAQNYSRGGVEKSGLGYDLAMSTEGYRFDEKTGNAYTTSIIVLDGEQRTLANGAKGEEVNYYAGLRNIDSYIKAKGVIGFEDREIYIRADNLLVAAKAEIAIGQLPGSLYNCTAECGNKIVPIDNFGRKDDVLTSIAFKLDGKGELFIIPGLESANATPDTNFLSLKANFEFNPLKDNSDRGSYVSISNEDQTASGTNVSSINLNKIQGDLGVEARIHMKKDRVVLDNQVKFNRQATDSSLGKVFSAEVAMMPKSGNMQKIADFVIPGGTMRSTLGIAPR